MLSDFYWAFDGEIIRLICLVRSEKYGLIYWRSIRRVR